MSDIEKMSRTEWEHLIDEYIFNEVHRKLMKRRMLDGIVYEQLAEEFGYSVNHTRHICSDCRRKLYRILK